MPSPIFGGSGGSGAVSSVFGRTGTITAQNGDYGNVVYVNKAATGGDGTSGTPWTGWDTAITWTSNATYYFPNGTYSYSTSPNFLLAGAQYIGESSSGTILKFTGGDGTETVTANVTATNSCAVVFSNAGLDGTSASWTKGVRFENFRIVGNANATTGLFLQGVRNSIFRNISICDVTTNAVEMKALVTNVLDNVRCTAKEGTASGGTAFTVKPACGLKFDRRQAGEQTTTTTVINPVMEWMNGTGGKGMWFTNTFNNVIIGGTSESNDSNIVLDSGSSKNSFYGIDVEQAATGYDIDVVSSADNIFIGLNSNSSTSVRVTSGQRNVFKGGNYGAITVANICTGTVLDSLTASSLTDSGHVVTQKNFVIGSTYQPETRNQWTNGDTVMLSRRKTNTSPTGNFIDFQDASGSSLFTVDITGSVATGTIPISTGVSGLGSGIATFLVTPSSANLASAITNETGSGALVFATNPALVTPDIGTPSAGTLTNCTALPISGLTASTSTALGVGSIELGHATNTTLSQSSAGVLAVEGVVVPTISSSNTLTNKTVDGQTNTLTKIPVLYSLSSDFTTTSTTFVDATGLSFAVAASKNYAVTIHLAINKSDAAGLQAQLTGPASPTAVSTMYHFTASSTGAEGRLFQSAFGSGSGTVSTYTGDGWVGVSAVISNGSSAGTVQVQLKAVTSGTAKIYAGSWIEVTLLN